MEQYPFYAEVRWMYYENGVRTTKREALFFMAEDYAQAAGKIEEDYGEELDRIDRLECIGDSTMSCTVETGREILKSFQNYDFAETVEVYDYNKKKVSV